MWCSVMFVLVAGCSGGAEAVTTDRPAAVTPTVLVATPRGSATSTTSSPATSVSSTVRPTSTAEGANVPAAARAHTNGGGEAFAKFYLEQLNASWMAADPEPLKTLSLSTCKTCANYIETAESLREAGDRYAGPPGTYRLSIVLPESTGNTKYVEMTYYQNAEPIIGSEGQVVSSNKRLTAVSVMTVQWTSSGWRMAEVQSQKQGR